MDKSLLLVTLPIALAAGFGLLKGIPLLQSVLHAEELAVLPLASGAIVDVREAGELVLSLRGTLGSRDFAGASFILRDAAGNPAPSSLIVMRTARTSLAGETTLAVRRFTIASPGRYQLDVAGLEPDRISANSRLVLSRTGGARLAFRVLWVVVAAVALLAGIVLSAVVAFAQPAPVAFSEPAAGSAVRSDILNSVRSALAIPADGESRFKVFHLRSAGAWAYFEGNEVVHVGGPEWQETDLTARALLQLEAGEWQVRAIWSLPASGETLLAEFERQISELRERFSVPAAIFP